MNNDSTFPNVDNLTPFEYALAGVETPDAQDSPSLGVIQQMRKLAAEVDDATITDPGLQELMRNGSVQSRRNDRRTVRKQKKARPTTAADAAAIVSDEGGFVDITPIEFSDTGPVTTLGTPLHAGIDDAAAIDLDDPTGEMQAISVDQPEPPQEPATPAAAEESEDATESDEAKSAEVERLDQAIVQAQALLAVDAVTSKDDIQADAASTTNAGNGNSSNGSARIGSASNGDAPVDDLASATDDFEDLDLTLLDPNPQDGEFFVLDDGTELPMAAAGNVSDADNISTVSDIEPPLLPSLFPDVPDDDGFHDVAHAAPNGLAAEAPIGSDPQADDDGAVLVGVGAGAMAGILNSKGDVYAEPAPGDPLDAFSGATPSDEGRQFGGAFWALTGTAAAAAVLVLGALWWANGLGDGTETEAATDTTDLQELLDTESTLAGSESSNDGEAAIGSSLGDLEVETGEDGDDVKPDGSQTTSRSSGADTTAAPNTTASSSTAVPATTSATAATAEPDTTAAPNTTERSTTATTPETTTTTEAPTTTKAPETTIPVTPAPLGFIGDSVNLGSFGGPGVAGARVDLFEDTDGDGSPEQLFDSQVTSGSGRYAFNVPEGCYVVRFNPVRELDVDEDLASQPVCVGPGESRARIDGIFYERQDQQARQPDGCLVERRNGSLQGVEVYENGQDWADSYIFYDDDGDVVYRTPSEPHDTDGSSNTDYEWVGDIGGFDHRDVRTVAADRGGNISARITCERE